MVFMYSFRKHKKIIRLEAGVVSFSLAIDQILPETGFGVTFYEADIL